MAGQTIPPGHRGGGGRGDRRRNGDNVNKQKQRMQRNRDSPQMGQCPFGVTWSISHIQSMITDHVSPSCLICHKNPSFSNKLDSVLVNLNTQTVEGGVKLFGFLRPSDCGRWALHVKQSNSCFSEMIAGLFPGRECLAGKEVLTLITLH